MGNEAQEFHGRGARVLELVFNPPRHKDGRSRLQETLLVPLHDDPVSLQNIHFVFVRVAVQWRVPPRNDLEMPHGKSGSTIRIVDQTTDLAPGRSRHVNWGRFNLIVGDDLHGNIPRRVFQNRL